MKTQGKLLRYRKHKSDLLSCLSDQGKLLKTAHNQLARVSGYPRNEEERNWIIRRANNLISFNVSSKHQTEQEMEGGMFYWTKLAMVIYLPEWHIYKYGFQDKLLGRLKKEGKSL